MEKNYIWPEITKDTDPMDVIKIHELIWDWVVSYGHKPLTPYIGDCALCEYLHRTSSEICLCGMHCVGTNVSRCLYGMYSKWLLADWESEESKRLHSIKIRDFFKNGLHVKNTSTKIGRKLNNKIGGKNDGN